MTQPADGLRRLPQSADVVDLRNRHRDFYLSLVRNAREADRFVADDDEWADLLVSELDNLRAAMEWSLSSDGAIPAQELAAGCLDVWWRGNFTEGRLWLGRALSATEARPPERARALLALAEIAQRLGEPAEALRCGDEAAEVSRESGDARLLSYALITAGWARVHAGRVDEATAMLDEAIDHAGRTGDKPLLAVALRVRGWVSFNQADLHDLRARHEEALSILEGESENVLVAHFESHANALRQCKDLDGAAAMYERALAIRRQARHPGAPLLCLRSLAEMAIDGVDVERARELYAEVAAIGKQVGDAEYATRALQALGLIEMQHRGDRTAAKGFFGDAVALVMSTRAEPGYMLQVNLANCLEALADLAELDGDSVAARRFIDQWLTIPRQIRDLIHPIGLLSQLSFRLGDVGTGLRDGRRELAEIGRSGSNARHLARVRATLAAGEGRDEEAYAILTAGFDPAVRATWHLQTRWREYELARFALRAGDLEVARAAMEEATLNREGPVDRTFWPLALLAEVELAEGNAAAAGALVRDLLSDWRYPWRAYTRVEFGDLLARTAIAEGRTERGAELLGVVESERHRLQYVVPAYTRRLLDTATSMATAAMGDEAFEAAVERGRQIEISEAFEREARGVGA